MGQVRYSADAVADLEKLRTYIAQHNPCAAQAVAQRIVKSASRLQRHPKFGKAGRVEGTRELASPKFPYTIIYEEDQGDCMILRVLHQAMQ